MRPNHRAVNDQVFQVRVAGEMLKHLFPDAFVSPTGESFIDTVPIPVFGRKQPPLGAGAVNPQHSLDKSLAIFFLSDIQAGAATQEIENPVPLFCWQLNI